MSWFQDLAGHAEQILNKIDQNAANVLHTTPGTMSTSSSTQNLLSYVETTREINDNDTASSEAITKSPLRGLKLEFNARKSSEKSSSSRRSSFSSRKEGTVIENNTAKQSSNPDTPVEMTVEKELASLKMHLIEIKLERDEVKQELETLMEQFKLTKNYKDEKNELKDDLFKLQEERDDFIEKINSLEESNLKYIKSISELEINVSKLHANEIELLKRIENLEVEKGNSITELQKYRQRAQNTLQIKENIIKELNSSINSSNPDMTSFTEDYEMLRNENHLIKSQLEQLNETVRQLNATNQQVEHELNQKLIQASTNYSKLYDNLNSEINKNVILENNLNIKNKELISIQDELVRLRENLSNQLYEKGIELNKIKSQLATSQSNNTCNGRSDISRKLENGNNIEERIQSLTQSLVQKQTTLEQLTAERNALRLQLEKIEMQHRTTILQIRKQKPQILNMNDTDDAKAQVPNFLQENPFDTTVARRVKRAYSSLDSVSVRLGVFLRRFPLIRILVIFYMILLHLWVLLVLFSSTPSSS